MLKLLFLLASGALAAVYHNEQVCDGPYALCSAAHCSYLPGNSSFASCSCVGPYTGLNLGLANNTCKSRTESLISTFSLRNPYAPPSQYDTASSGSRGAFSGGSQGSVPPVYAIPCTGSNAAPWTDWQAAIQRRGVTTITDSPSSNGAPCTVSRSGAVTCICPVQPASDNFYYGNECPKSDSGLTALCKQLRSTASAPASATRENMPRIIEAATLGAFYGNQNQISSCS